jgi:hypothetical protein
MIVLALAVVVLKCRGVRTARKATMRTTCSAWFGNLHDHVRSTQMYSIIDNNSILSSSVLLLAAPCILADAREQRTHTPLSSDCTSTRALQYCTLCLIHHYGSTNTSPPDLTLLCLSLQHRYIY